jgi:hypothetical protein
MTAFQLRKPLQQSQSGQPFEFDIIKPLGSGTYGKTFLARVVTDGDASSGSLKDKQIVLKFFWVGSIESLQDALNSPQRQDFLDDHQSYKAQFDTENVVVPDLERITDSLTRKPLIPAFYGMVRDDSRNLTAIAMEYVQLTDIRKWLREAETKRPVDRPLLNERVAIHITIQFLQLLDSIHQKRRFLKDAQFQNIWVNQLVDDPINLQMRILDWNGTLPFEAGIEYEHAAGHDIWRALSYLFQMLTGNPLDNPMPPVALDTYGDTCWQRGVSYRLKAFLKFFLSRPLGTALYNQAGHNLVDGKHTSLVIDILQDISNKIDDSDPVIPTWMDQNTGIENKLAAGELYIAFLLNIDTVKDQDLSLDDLRWRYLHHALKTDGSTDAQTARFSIAISNIIKDLIQEQPNTTTLDKLSGDLKSLGRVGGDAGQFRDVIAGEIDLRKQWINDISALWAGSGTYDPTMFNRLLGGLNEYFPVWATRLAHLFQAGYPLVTKTDPEEPTSPVTTSSVADFSAELNSQFATSQKTSAQSKNVSADYNNLLDNIHNTPHDATTHLQAMLKLVGTNPGYKNHLSVWYETLDLLAKQENYEAVTRYGWEALQLIHSIGAVQPSDAVTVANIRELIHIADTQTQRTIQDERQAAQWDFEIRRILQDLKLTTEIAVIKTGIERLIDIKPNALDGKDVKTLPHDLQTLKSGYDTAGAIPADGAPQPTSRQALAKQTTKLYQRVSEVKVKTSDGPKPLDLNLFFASLVDDLRLPTRPTSNTGVGSSILPTVIIGLVMLGLGAIFGWLINDFMPATTGTPTVVAVALAATTPPAITDADVAAITATTAIVETIITPTVPTEMPTNTPTPTNTSTLTPTITPTATLIPPTATPSLDTITIRAASDISSVFTGQSVDFMVNNPIEGVTYTWNANVPTDNMVTTAGADGTTASVRFLQSGNQTVMLTASRLASNGQSETRTQYARMNVTAPTLSIELASGQNPFRLDDTRPTVRTGEALQLTATTDVAAADSPSFSWRIVEDSNFVPTEITPFSFNRPDPGDYTVQVTMTTRSGVTSTPVDYRIQVRQPLTVAIVGASGDSLPVEGIEQPVDGLLTLKAAITPADATGITYKWTVDGGIVAAATTDTLPLSVEPGTYTVRVDATNGYGDVGTAELTPLTINPRQLLPAELVNAEPIRMRLNGSNAVYNWPSITGVTTNDEGTLIGNTSSARDIEAFAQALYSPPRSEADPDPDTDTESIIGFREFTGESDYVEREQWSTLVGANGVSPVDATQQTALAAALPFYVEPDYDDPSYTTFTVPLFKDIEETSAIPAEITIFVPPRISSTDFIPYFFIIGQAQVEGVTYLLVRTGGVVVDPLPVVDQGTPVPPTPTPPPIPASAIAANVTHYQGWLRLDDRNAYPMIDNLNFLYIPPIDQLPYVVTTTAEITGQAIEADTARTTDGWQTSAMVFPAGTQVVARQITDDKDTNDVTDDTTVWWIGGIGELNGQPQWGYAQVSADQIQAVRDGGLPLLPVMSTPTPTDSPTEESTATAEVGEDGTPAYLLSRNFPMVKLVASTLDTVVLYPKPSSTETATNGAYDLNSETYIVTLDSYTTNSEGNWVYLSDSNNVTGWYQVEDPRTALEVILDSGDEQLTRYSSLGISNRSTLNADTRVDAFGFNTDGNLFLRQLNVAWYQIDFNLRPEILSLLGYRVQVMGNQSDIPGFSGGTLPNSGATPESKSLILTLDNGWLQEGNDHSVLAYLVDASNVTWLLVSQRGVSEPDESKAVWLQASRFTPLPRGVTYDQLGVERR